MKYGSSFGSGFGSPENCFSNFSTLVEQEKIRLSFTTIFAGWYAIYRDSSLIQYRYCSVNDAVTLWIPADIGVTKQNVCVLRCGSAQHTMQRPARWYDSRTSKRSTLYWEWQPEIMGSVDTTLSTVCSSWSLSGILWSLLSPVSGSRCRGRITVDLRVDGSTVEVSLLRGNYLAAYGTGTLGNPVALAGDISGAVTVAIGATTGTETLYIRYPVSMMVKRDSVRITDIPYRGTSEGYFRENDDLVSGTYSYTLTPISDTGDTGVESDPLVMTINSPPEAASGLAFISGNAASPLIGFTKSATAGVSYNTYLQTPNDNYLNLHNPIAITYGVSGFSGFSGCLPSMASGISRVTVRAEINGIEEQTGTTALMEFDGTNYIADRPNAITITKTDVTSGRTINVYACYDPMREIGVATHVHCYAKPAGGSYPLTPDGEENLISEGAVKTATISYSAPSDGWYTVRIFATTSGNVESVYYAEENVFVSSVDATKSDIAGYGTRG